MDLRELRAIIGRLRIEGGDVADIEAKTAADGFPKTVTSTLSAFANTPGGGLLIFGVDERSGFTATGVYDVALCKSALATVARQNLVPPITFEVQDFEFEGARVVVAQVHEIPNSAKPCHVRSTGKAYLRAHDGDYELSQIEEQAFLASRDTPRFDQATISGATRDDLDPELLISYIVSSRAGSTSLARLSDDDILFRTGVTAARTERLQWLACSLSAFIPSSSCPTRSFKPVSQRERPMPQVSVFSTCNVSTVPSP
ncbi:helix-turn-helix domain-containing protein [Streptosporangium lutulentum]